MTTMKLALGFVPFVFVAAACAAPSEPSPGGITREHVGAADVAALGEGDTLVLDLTRDRVVYEIDAPLDLSRIVLREPTGQEDRLDQVMLRRRDPSSPIAYPFVVAGRGEDATGALPLAAGVAPEAMKGGGPGSSSSGGLGFSCENGACVCVGWDDCKSMSTNVPHCIAWSCDVEGGDIACICAL